jgi:hypothetical protein
MSECQNLKTCAFFAYYEKTKGNNLALKGFVTTFCKGQKQDECSRKKVSKALGGSSYVPVNMMPNGLPLSSTDSKEWPKQVKDNL